MTNDAAKPETDYSLLHAADIAKRAEKTCGRTMWSRMTGDARLVECKAMLCDDMIKDTNHTAQSFWVSVARHLVNITISE